MIPVRMRVASIRDAEEIVAKIDAASLQNFSFFTEPVTVEREREYLQRMISSEIDHLFLIIRNSDNELLGSVGLHEVDIYNHTARVGMIICDPSDRGHHYGSAAMELICEFGFRALRLNKIYANVLTTNTAQIERDKQFGFEEEGILRKSYFLNGEYHDMVHMGLIRADWEKHCASNKDK